MLVVQPRKVVSPPECVGARMAECGGLDRRGGGRAGGGWPTGSGELQARLHERQRAAIGAHVGAGEHGALRGNVWPHPNRGRRGDGGGSRS